MAVPLRVAACHAAPIFLSARKTTDKAISLINRAATNNAHLVVFPETFIPAFPIWSAVRPPTENHDLFKRMALESVYADGEEMRAIREAARKNRTLVSLGFSEKARHSSACLYNSNIMINSDGQILVHHRKLVATFFEKLTWSHGDGYGLRVCDTPVGRIGNLICGENTNPLARFSLMAQGEQVHISSWPAIWPTRAPSPVSSNNASTSDSSAGGSTGASNYDNVAANRIRAAAHCFEAKCFGVVCAGHLGADAIEVVAEGSLYSEAISKTLQSTSRAATLFLDPTGTQIRGFTVDSATGMQIPTDFLQHEEGILYADMNLEDCIEGKQYHDVVGGYQRLDVFDLKVNRSRRAPVKFYRYGNSQASPYYPYRPLSASSSVRVAGRRQPPIPYRPIPPRLSKPSVSRRNGSTFGPTPSATPQLGKPEF
ncbi:carbon-nitrogen hydrolase [Xylaria acuta]|nr:carbon-nitrogen hydrolase [Xylaria acuta]